MSSFLLNREPVNLDIEPGAGFIIVGLIGLIFGTRV